MPEHLIWQFNMAPVALVFLSNNGRDFTYRF